MTDWDAGTENRYEQRPHHEPAVTVEDLQLRCNELAGWMRACPQLNEEEASATILEIHALEAIIDQIEGSY